MMRSYLLALLLIFFRLIHISLSASVPPSLTKVIFKQVRGKGINNAWENALGKIKQNFSPPQPNAPPTQIQGLSSIKEYFSNYGYLQSSAPFNDYLDQETISAITTFQQYFNLQVTGDLNDETLHQMSLTRCVVPDVNYDYNFAGDDISWPKAGNQWFPNGKNLTYGFLRQSKIPAKMMGVLRDAFKRWAEATAVLNLTETTFDDADIKVGFYIFNYTEDEVFGGSIIRMQLNSNVTTGEIRLDANKLWAVPSENDTLSWEDGVLDLESVAMHEMGHLLGLDHSNEEDSVMYPYILPSQQRKVELSDSDKDNILRQYNNANSGPAVAWQVLYLPLCILGLLFCCSCKCWIWCYFYIIIS